MIVGFNHNMTYRGVCFHVQTEDSGIKTPHLITLLYHGGTIISSQKTSYADILNVDNLDLVIEDLAKEQHKGMLRRLKKGEFDQRIIDYGIKISPAAPVEQPAAVGETEAVSEVEEVDVQVATDDEPESTEKQIEPKPDVEFPEPEDITAADADKQAFAETLEPEPESTDLDDLIFSYLSGDDGKK